MGPVALMREIRNTNGIFVRKSGGVRHRHICEVNIKTDHMEVVCEDVDRIYVHQSKIQDWALV